MNIYTSGPHARRSRLMFRQVFGDRIEVGVLSVDSLDFDSGNWWRRSGGVRAMIHETIAYVYSRFLFSPPALFL